MGRYRIEIKKSAAKELRRIPKKDLQKIIPKIQALSDNPKPVNCKKLVGQNHYRIRIGNYRVLYVVEKSFLVIYIIKIGDRKKIYQ